jgi:hypothetical protein
LPAAQEELAQREKRWVARQEGRKREARQREAQAVAWQAAKLEEEQEVLAQLVSEPGSESGTQGGFGVGCVGLAGLVDGRHVLGRVCSLDGRLACDWGLFQLKAA